MQIAKMKSAKYIIFYAEKQGMSYLPDKNKTVERRTYTSGHEDVLLIQSVRTPSRLCDFVARYKVLSA